jgi:predicted Zn-dependent protease
MRFHSTSRWFKSNRLLRLRRAKAPMLKTAAAVALTLVAAGCATPPIEKTITPAERIQRDQALGAGLARQFEARLKLKSDDKAVLIYLGELTKRLGAASDDLKSAAIAVQVISDRGGRWRDYSIPGNRVYLSVGLLKAVKYENELAAALAVELAHLLARHVPQRIQAARAASSASQPADYPSIEGLVPSTAGLGRETDFFSPTGLFAFPDEYMLETVEPAVGILYRAGFDARGLVSLWGLYRSNPAHSPLEGGILDKLTEKTRTVIAEYSPLRNPIVRSQAFIAIQKRIKRL